jgi:hypothetical protein
MMGLKDFFKKKPTPASEAKDKAKMLVEVKKKEKIIENLNKQKINIDIQNKLLEEEINKMLKIKDGKFVQSEPQSAPQQQYVPQQPQPAPQQQYVPTPVPQPPYAPQMQTPLPPQPQYAPQPQERQFQPQMPPAQPELVEVVLRLVDGSELSVAVPTTEVQHLVNEIADSMEKKTFVKLNTTFVSGDKIVFFKLI